jgi:SagB-type dehydrogenase family enzyme
MQLPKPNFNGEMALEAALKNRRTIRAFRPEPISTEFVSQMLWAAYGVTEQGGFKRSAASGGALYPLDLYAVIGESGVSGVAQGLYHYQPLAHRLDMLSDKDLRQELAKASLGQIWMARAPVSLVITAEFSRICRKYGERGKRYALIETGHVGQNIFLQAEALGLGAGIVGAFQDDQVMEILGLPQTHEPLLIMPVGKKG